MVEIYVSVDIEADGPIPGDNSMLSLGAIAFDKNGQKVDSWYSTLEPLPGASPDENTMKWWDKNLEAYNQATLNPIPAKNAMINFSHWLKRLEKLCRGKVVFVGYPASYDFMWAHWYLIHFTGADPFSHSALDIKTLAWAFLDMPFRQTTKRNMPKEWFGNARHTHHALDDAQEQGELFFKICGDLKSNLL